MEAGHDYGVWGAGQYCLNLVLSFDTPMTRAIPSTPFSTSLSCPTTPGVSRYFAKGLFATVTTVTYEMISMNAAS